MAKKTKKRLEELRKLIRDEEISYAEVSELQSLVEHIDKDDIELLQWAKEDGVDE